MDIRDQFAGLAMQGILVNAGQDYVREGIAIMAYQMADAMIDERNLTLNKESLTNKLIDKKCGLTIRTVNVLLAEGITNYHQLINTSAKKLIRAPNFGMKSVNEVITHLEAIGFTLKDADNPYEPI
jgi:DNA-directed RNA polymerase alpha subunit